MWVTFNKTISRDAPAKVMRFGGSLAPISRQILSVDPALGLVYLSKVDLEDAYMRILVRM